MRERSRPSPKLRNNHQQPEARSSHRASPFLEIIMTEDWIARVSEAEKLRDELAIINRQTLFDALSAAGITSVTVEFDGYGDEGQIVSAKYFVGEDETTPSLAPLLFVRDIADDTAQSEPVSLEDAIDELLYHLLSKHYGGWQDNEGSFGEFTFDIPARTIDLDIGMRFVDASHYQHKF
jgi:hypothetical protein